MMLSAVPCAFLPVAFRKEFMVLIKEYGFRDNDVFDALKLMQTLCRQNLIADRPLSDVSVNTIHFFISEFYRLNQISASPKESFVPNIELLEKLSKNHPASLVQFVVSKYHCDNEKEFKDAIITEKEEINNTRFDDIFAFEYDVIFNDIIDDLISRNYSKEEIKESLDALKAMMKYDAHTMVPKVGDITVSHLQTIIDGARFRRDCEKNVLLFQEINGRSEIIFAFRAIIRKLISEYGFSEDEILTALFDMKEQFGDAKIAHITLEMIIQFIERGSKSDTSTASIKQDALPRESSTLRIVGNRNDTFEQKDRQNDSSARREHSNGDIECLEQNAPISSQKVSVSSLNNNGTPNFLDPAESSSTSTYSGRDCAEPTSSLINSSRDVNRFGDKRPASAGRIRDSRERTNESFIASTSITSTTSSTTPSSTTSTYPRRDCDEQTSSLVNSSREINRIDDRMSASSTRGSAVNKSNIDDMVFDSNQLYSDLSPSTIRDIRLRCCNEELLNRFHYSLVQAAMMKLQQEVWEFSQIPVNRIPFQNFVTILLHRIEKECAGSNRERERTNDSFVVSSSTTTSTTPSSSNSSNSSTSTSTTSMVSPRWTRYPVEPPLSSINHGKEVKKPNDKISASGDSNAEKDRLKKPTTFSTTTSTSSPSTSNSNYPNTLSYSGRDCAEPTSSLINSSRDVNRFGDKRPASAGRIRDRERANESFIASTSISSTTSSPTSTNSSTIAFSATSSTPTSTTLTYPGRDSPELTSSLVNSSRDINRIDDRISASSTRGSAVNKSSIEDMVFDSNQLYSDLSPSTILDIRYRCCNEEPLNKFHYSLVREAMLKLQQEVWEFSQTPVNSIPFQNLVTILLHRIEKECGQSKDVECNDTPNGRDLDPSNRLKLAFEDTNHYDYDRDKSDSIDEISYQGREPRNNQYDVEEEKPISIRSLKFNELSSYMYSRYLHDFFSESNLRDYGKENIINAIDLLKSESWPYGPCRLNEIPYSVFNRDLLVILNNNKSVVEEVSEIFPLRLSSTSSWDRNNTCGGSSSAIASTSSLSAAASSVSAPASSVSASTSSLPLSSSISSNSSSFSNRNQRMPIKVDVHLVTQCRNATSKLTFESQSYRDRRRELNLFLRSKDLGHTTCTVYAQGIDQLCKEVLWDLDYLNSHNHIIEFFSQFSNRDDFDLNELENYNQVAQISSVSGDHLIDLSSGYITICMVTEQMNLLVYPKPICSVGPALRFSAMRLEYPFNQAFTASIRRLQDQYVSYRNIRGDGNCYFRSICFAVLEQIVALYDFERLKWIRDLFFEHADFRDKKTLSEFFNKFQKHLIDDKSSVLSIRWLESCFDSLDLNLDEAVIRTCRKLVVAFIEKYIDVSYGNGAVFLRKMMLQYSNVKDLNSCCKEILKMSCDAEGPWVEVGILPFCLDVNCEIIHIDSRNNNAEQGQIFVARSSRALVSTSFDIPLNNTSADSRMTISIMLHSGHYRIIYM